MIPKIGENGWQAISFKDKNIIDCEIIAGPFYSIAEFEKSLNAQAVGATGAEKFPIYRVTPGDGSTHWTDMAHLRRKPTQQDNQACGQSIRDLIGWLKQDNCESTE